MIRKLVSGAGSDRNEKDGKRNYEIQRIETFSDGVFAFAVTITHNDME